MSWNGGGNAGTSTWDTTGGGGSAEWNENAASAATNGETFAEVGEDNFNGGFGGEDGGNAAGTSDTACRRCGKEGHFANDCDQPREFSGACFNCGEEGHSKADCTQPRMASGPCRVCEEEGHQGAQCPKRICRNCLGEGHNALECKENRIIPMQHIADKVPAQAWKDIEAASNDRDISDFKEAVLVLIKACPEMTYPQLEKEFRKRRLNVYLIALEKDHGDTLTVVNLQGELGKKYVVSYFLSDKPQRPMMKERWPASTEDNLARLEDAGIPMDRGVPKCNNCNEIGHVSKACPQERTEIERAKVTCALHRARDCNNRPPPRPGKECRVCQATDHQAKDCPNKEKRTCRNCGSEDHVAKECDQPRDPAKMQCRNCDQFGHSSRDCTAPKDWSKVKCNNCGEMGHTVKRCKEPSKEADGAGDDAGGFGGESGGGGGFSGGGGDWEEPDTNTGSAQPEWEINNAETSSFGGGAPVAVGAGGGGW